MSVEILQIASRCTTIPMTVKMRIGPRDDKKIAHNLIPKVAEWGASAITIHGRSRQVKRGPRPVKMRFLGFGTIFCRIFGRVWGRSDRSDTRLEQHGKKTLI